MVFKLHGSVDWARLVERPYDEAGSDTLTDSAEKFELAGAYVISILNCGDSMTEERKHAILFAATILAHAS